MSTEDVVLSGLRRSTWVASPKMLSVICTSAQHCRFCLLGP
jgi:hypothetical protein